MAVTSGRGNRPRPVKVRVIAAVPNRPRHTWPIGFLVTSPWRSSPVCQSQARMTGMQKKERKKTASPEGTSRTAILIIADMTMNRKTDSNFKATAVPGRCSVKGIGMRHP